MKIGFMLHFHPNKSSKKYYYMLDALRRNGNEIIPLYPIKATIAEFIMLRINSISKKVTDKQIAPYHNSFIAYFQQKKLKKLLKNKKVDAIFAPFSSVVLSKLRIDIPVIYCSDTTFSNMIGYYPKYSNLWTRCIEIGNAIELNAIRKSKFCIFPSVWATRSAIEDYKASPQKIFNIPFGANIDNKFVDKITSKVFHKGETLQLLFIAVEWERKGGDIAVKIIESLNKYGIVSHLTICGIKPPDSIKSNYITIIDKLDKNNPADLEVYIDLFKNNHVFLLPVRAECMGHVFCEASAFGLPSITTSTGGVDSVVIDGKNGYALPFDETGNLYVEAIIKLIESGEYESLSNSSIDIYNKYLSWDVWALKVNELLKRSVL